MTITTRVALAFAGTLLLASVLFPHVSAAWQRPPEADLEGTEYLKVNINPTPTPPRVNINPGGRVPRVNVNRMPDIRIQPTGCDSRTNFETRVGGSITGPIVLTFLSLGAGVEMSLESGDQSADGLPAETALLATAIYLGRGETLRFSQPVLYSGCRPA